MSEEAEVEALYRRLHAAWNARDAGAMGALFSDDALVIGYDGSVSRGAAEFTAHLAPIFGHHQTPPYVASVHEVRALGGGLYLLLAAAGLVIDGALKAELNAWQTMVAAKGEHGWLIELFQNTPAAYDGRPELAEGMAEELRAETGRL